MKDESIVACLMLLLVTLLQILAWYMGKNGTIFALTSSSITAIAAYFFGRYKHFNN